MDTTATFHDQIIKDKQITGMMPVLQSRVLTCKESVDAYLQSFHPFSSLWQSDLASVYAAFLAKNPQLEVKHTDPESALQYQLQGSFLFFNTNSACRHALSWTSLLSLSWNFAY